MWRRAVRPLSRALTTTAGGALLTTRCDADWRASAPELGPPRVHRIVVTGGPCAGKTTAMSKLSLRLRNMGFDVYVVPELATLTINAGAAPGSYSKEQHRDWEVAILRLQMALEDGFAEIAERCSLTEGKHAVLLCDRGTMDVLAYLQKEVFDEVLEENGWTIPQLRDKRYEAVVHLVTAAVGAEEHYTLENNKARMESREAAAALDGRLSRAWVGHNSLHVVDNADGFDEKMRRATECVCRALGVPGPRATPRWWIVDQRRPIPRELEHAEWTLEHTFLKTADGTESRITRKSQPGVTTYHHRVRRIAGEDHATAERALGLREYKALLANKDPARCAIKKTRRAFLWNNEYYLLDTFHSPASAAGTTTLFVETPASGSTEFPPFLRPKVDVTTTTWFDSKAHDSYERTIAMAEDLTPPRRTRTSSGVQTSAPG
mmetsp:Transcript_16490/g.49240  ORF Transcript_16490/g.49240 Transcript_16490/m.49240 type:complete len:434 (-) Transcript_16490:31-1332(-)